MSANRGHLGRNRPVTRFLSMTVAARRLGHVTTPKILKILEVPGVLETLQYPQRRQMISII